MRNTILFLPQNLDLYQACQGQPLVLLDRQQSSISRQLFASLKLLREEERELQSSSLITIRSDGKEQGICRVSPPPSVKCPSYSKTDLPCQMSLSVSISNYLSLGADFLQSQFLTIDMTGLLNFTKFARHLHYLHFYDFLFPENILRPCQLF